jgi:hypothetical protein
MRRRRYTFTLWQVVILVGALCLVLGFLRYAMARWKPADVVLLTLMILSAASVWCCLRGRRAPASWVSFALFGWGYLVTSLGPLGEHFPTTQLLAAAHDRLFPAPLPSGSWEDIGKLEAWKWYAGAFVIAGQSLICLPVAILGGFVGTMVVGWKGKEAPVILPREGSLLNPGWLEERRNHSSDAP